MLNGAAAWLAAAGALWCLLEGVSGEYPPERSQMYQLRTLTQEMQVGAREEATSSAGKLRCAAKCVFSNKCLFFRYEGSECRMFVVEEDATAVTAIVTGTSLFVSEELFPMESNACGSGVGITVSNAAMSALLVACPEHVTWDAAQAVCAQLGRGLAVPDTPERNPPVEEAVLRVHDALTDMGMALTGFYWIGARCEVPDGTTGCWQWQLENSQAPMVFDQWLTDTTGQVASGLGPHCSLMEVNATTTHGNPPFKPMWDARPCDDANQVHPFVCEIVLHV